MTIGFDNKILKKPDINSHSHEPLSNDQIECLVCESEIKTKVIESMMPIQEIYENCLTDLTQKISIGSIVQYLDPFEVYQKQINQLKAYGVEVKLDFNEETYIVNLDYLRVIDIPEQARS